MEKVVEEDGRKEREVEFKEDPERLRVSVTNLNGSYCVHKKGKSDCLSISYLHVLLIREILAILLKYLDPQNAVEFLSIHPLATYDMTGWTIMRRTLGISNKLMVTKLISFNGSSSSSTTDPAAAAVDCNKVPYFDGAKPILYADERDFMLHIIRKYGFCCTECFTLLDGPNGFFCCTSLCKTCSEAKFQGAEFVDSVVRFYLCGDENITVRGRAFLVHPFWYSLHDESTPLIAKYGSSLHIAELIYKEKVFFSTHAPFIERPRDDKAASLVRMLQEEVELMRMESEVEAEEGTEQDETGNCKSNGTAGSAIGIEIRPRLDSVSTEMWTPLCPNLHHTHKPTPEADKSADSQTNAATVSASVVPSSPSRQSLTVEERAKVLAHINQGWGALVPNSLHAMYVQAISVMATEPKAQTNKPTLGKSALGTMPLRDLVKSLHNKSAGNVKVMREQPTYDKRQS